MHLVPESTAHGHFNVLRGYVRSLGLAGIKVVPDYYHNFERGLPSELAVLNLLDADTGVLRAFLDATEITDMRTGAVTALGAKYLARRDSKVLGHIGARGTSYHVPSGPSPCSPGSRCHSNDRQHPSVCRPIAIGGASGSS